MALTFRCLVDDHERCGGVLSDGQHKCGCYCHKREGGAARDDDHSEPRDIVAPDHERDLTDVYCQ